MEHEEDEDSSSNLTPVNIPKGQFFGNVILMQKMHLILGKEKEGDFAAPKGQKLTDLDEEGIQNKAEDSGNVVEQTVFF